MKNKVNGNIKKDRVKRLLALSKELEITNLHKNINRDIVFIPEVYRDGYLIGHTGDYLLIKAKGDEKYLSKEVLAKTKEVSYPYLISEVSVKQ